jgi:hypothetical protein
MNFDELAARQRGYLDRAEARAAGLTDRQIEWLAERHHWQRPHPGVYRTGSVPPMWEDRVRAAVKAAGPLSRAMGRTAARLRGYDGAESHSIIELTVPIGHGPVPHGVIVHRTRRLDPTLTAVIGGIPVSSANQTLLEYAWLVKVDLLVERAVENALLRGDTSEASLWRFLATCGPGVPGVRRLRRVLERRAGGRPARSGFEVIVFDILREAGIRLPIRRPLVSVPPDQKFELDLAYVQEKIDLEPMGSKWHSTRQQRAIDAERRRVLGGLGWDVIPIFHDEAMNTPWSIVDRVNQALDRARQ